MFNPKYNNLNCSNPSPFRRDTLPFEDYYTGLPLPYLEPWQSKYHNLGMNGFIAPHYPQTKGFYDNPLVNNVYPGKNFGRLSDYGPRQISENQVPGNYPYPLDVKKDLIYNVSAELNKGTLQRYESSTLDL